MSAPVRRCEGCGRYALHLYENGGELPDGRFESLLLASCCAAPASIHSRPEGDQQ